MVVQATQINRILRVSQTVSNLFGLVNTIIVLTISMRQTNLN
jgi:hypothetical protein